MLDQGGVTWDDTSLISESWNHRMGWDGKEFEALLILSLFHGGIPSPVASCPLVVTRDRCLGMAETEAGQD